ncbi:hypothetical protein [Providencia sp. PROV024]|nr:hypothetical protein [Providencia sp. PROV024]WOC05427.1 hypothetical protein P3L56_06535 [Providencia sp. PROV024]
MQMVKARLLLRIKESPLTRRDAMNKKAATELTARGRAGMKLIIYLCK